MPLLLKVLRCFTEVRAQHLTTYLGFPSIYPQIYMGQVTKFDGEGDEMLGDKEEPGNVVTLGSIRGKPRICPNGI